MGRSQKKNQPIYRLKILLEVDKFNNLDRGAASCHHLVISTGHPGKGSGGLFDGVSGQQISALDGKGQDYKYLVLKKVFNHLENTVCRVFKSILKS